MVGAAGNPLPLRVFELPVPIAAQRLHAFFYLDDRITLSIILSEIVGGSWLPAFAMPVLFFFYRGYRGPADRKRLYRGDCA